MLLSVLNVIIYALIVIIAIILVVLILIQPSKGGGLGSAFGGAGENVFGAHAMDHASKLTVVLITVFFLLTLALTAISAHSGISDSEESDPQEMSEDADAGKTDAQPIANNETDAPQKPGQDPETEGDQKTEPPAGADDAK